MPRFRYKAIDADGRRVSGQLDAANDSDLERRLRTMGLDLMSARACSQDRAGRRRMQRKDLITLCHELEQITRAGLPLAEGMRDLRDGVDGLAVRDVLTSLIEDIEGGRTLSQAMSRFPLEFPQVLVSLVASGELAGRLPEVLARLVSSLRWEDELRSHTRKLMIYPACVGAVVLLTVVFLLVYLVPQVVTLFRNMGLALPLQTRVLIAASEMLTTYWWLLLASTGCAGFLALALLKSARGRETIDELKLRLPVIGPVLQKIILARFASFFALMYQSGITVLDALRTSEAIVGNRIVARGLSSAALQISGGRRLSEALAGTGLFPPLVIRMTRVGENTGGLDAALLNVHYLYEREVREGIDQALRLLEPLMTAVLGAILALILFSVLAPLYDVIGRIRF